MHMKGVVLPNHNLWRVTETKVLFTLVSSFVAWWRHDHDHYISVEVELDQEETAPTSTTNMSSKKKELQSTAMKRTSEWFDSLPFCFIYVFIEGINCFSFLFLSFSYNYALDMTNTINLYRIFSQEIPSDVTVHAGGASFSLHKVGFSFQIMIIRDWRTINNSSLVICLLPVLHYNLDFVVCINKSNQYQEKMTR